MRDLFHILFPLLTTHFPKGEINKNLSAEQQKKKEIQSIRKLDPDAKNDLEVCNLGYEIIQTKIKQTVAQAQCKGNNF